MAKIVKLSEGKEKAIEKALEVLASGGIIVYPTETSYGVGADALNAEAVGKVHETKRQPKDKPISVIVANEKQAEEVAEIGKKERELIHNFMPGPLTLICRQKEIVPKNLTTTGIAFRIPGNEFAKELAEKFGKAITATSANLHGMPAIYSGKEAIEVFGNIVDLIVDAGELPKREASTIYCLINNVMFREGKISKQELEKVLGKEIKVSGK